MNKTVAFITVHVGENFGSNLQAIATAEAIKKTGNNPLLINYCPKRVTRKQYWKIAFSNPIKLVWRLLYAPIFYRNLHIYEGFLKAHCNMTNPIYDSDDFIKQIPVADIYMTGSDQVWNSIHNKGLNKRYYFDGVSGKKVSFASSFGVVELPRQEFDKVKNMLSDYECISVREDSAKQIVESMGYNAQHLLDPTFVLNKDEWQQYATVRKFEKPYLLMYTPYNIVDKSILYKTARKIANEKGLSVVTFSWNLGGEPLADKVIRFASPGDFITLMSNADFIITNSFHGTAFSINLNKQFLVYLPSGFGTRIKSVLKQCNLESRLMTGEEIDISYNNPIDYIRTNQILELERTRTMDYLNVALQ